MASQSGKISNPAAPPFATKEGETTNDDKAGGHDFTKDPSGGGDKTPPVNHATQSRKQNAPPDGVTPNTEHAPWLRSRPQQAGSAAQRVNPASIPAGGIVMQHPPGPASQAIGATVSPKPFKGMK
jgi:hypothetical protein